MAAAVSQAVTETADTPADSTTDDTSYNCHWCVILPTYRLTRSIEPRLFIGSAATDVRYGFTMSVLVYVLQREMWNTRVKTAGIEGRILHVLNDRQNDVVIARLLFVYLVMFHCDLMLCQSISLWTGNNAFTCYWCYAE